MGERRGSFKSRNMYTGPTDKVKEGRTEGGKWDVGGGSGWDKRKWWQENGDNCT